MALFLTRTFQKNYLRLPKATNPKVEPAVREIYSTPLSGKKLLGDLEAEFSLRVGAYRIIYFVDRDKNIWVETVRYRKEVYKKQGR